jgi:hypothetical protein
MSGRGAISPLRGLLGQLWQSVWISSQTMCILPFPPRRGRGSWVGLYALCAEEGQFLRFEQNVGRFLRFTHIWMK